MNFLYLHNLFKSLNHFGLRTGMGYSVTTLASILCSNVLRWNVFSIPVVAHFYLGDKRKFSSYIGPRFKWIVADIKREITIDINKDASYPFLQKKTQDIITKEKKFQLTWDLGFDYETDFGLFFGMEGLGLALGYNFGALL